MLTTALGLSAVTFAATVMHMRSQRQISSIAMKEMWKIRAYQEHFPQQDDKANL